MWISVNQPNFKELVINNVSDSTFTNASDLYGQVKEMFRPTFDQMDIRKIGFVSKDEYMKLNSWKAGEEQALAAFKMMDTDNDGQVTGISLGTLVPNSIIRYAST